MSDVIGLPELLVWLKKAPTQVRRNVGKARTVSARKIKDQAKKGAGGIGHAPYYPNSITYDLHDNGDEISAEIGPDKSLTQGALGNILEFGTSKNAPIPHLGPALYANEADFVNGVLKAIDEGLK